MSIPDVYQQALDFYPNTKEKQRSFVLPVAKPKPLPIEHEKALQALEDLAKLRIN